MVLALLTKRPRRANGSQEECQTVQSTASATGVDSNANIEDGEAQRHIVEESEVGPGFELDATIRLRADASAVLPRGGFDGMMPSFNYGEYLAACRIHTEGGVEIPFEVDAPVHIEVAYSVPAHGTLAPGSEFKLNAGGKVLGSGRVASVHRPT